MNFVEIKRQLHHRCLAIITERIAAAKQTMDDAQASANQEDKSSAGDKYETGRAMAQITRDQAAQQLDQTLQLKKVLDHMTTMSASNTVALGSLVVTDQTRFYISISIGKIILEEKEYLALSPQSPIGKMLMNRSVGDEIVFNRQKQTIRDVH
jgi:transcription elongation GreA/GreB family factor